MGNYTSNWDARYWKVLSVPPRVLRGNSLSVRSPSMRRRASCTSTAFACGFRVSCKSWRLSSDSLMSPSRGMNFGSNFGPGRGYRFHAPVQDVFPSYGGRTKSNPCTAAIARATRMAWLHWIVGMAVSVGLGGRYVESGLFQTFIRDLDEVESRPLPNNMRSFTLTRISSSPHARQTSLSRRPAARRELS